MSWETGRDNITTAALAGGELQRITGAQAAGAGWIADARTKLATAETISQSDPATAYVTAYDAARFALVAILAQQGPDFGAHDVEQVGGTILNRSSLGVASEAPSHSGRGRRASQQFTQLRRSVVLGLRCGVGLVSGYRSAERSAIS